MDAEGAANSQQRLDRDGPPGLDLLPVTSGESERDHILLAVALRFAGLAYSLPECLEEFLFIYHASGCRIPRAKTPRAD